MGRSLITLTMARARPFTSDQDIAATVSVLSKERRLLNLLKFDARPARLNLIVDPAR
jgi:hypothetical protein